MSSEKNQENLTDKVSDIANTDSNTNFEKTEEESTILNDSEILNDSDSLKSVEPVEAKQDFSDDVTPNEKKPRKKGGFLRFVLRTFMMMLVLIFLIAGYVAYDVWSFLSTPAETESREVHIFIEPGTNFDKVSRLLEKEHVITNAFRFKLLAQFQKKTALLKAGEFAVESTWTPEQILNHLIYGKPVLHRLVIREGLPYWEVAELVEEAGFANASDFLEIVKDKQFLTKHNIAFSTAEGFLFPNTYFLQKPQQITKEDAEKIASLMIKTFWTKNLPLLKIYLDQQNSQKSLEETKKIALETAKQLVSMNFIDVAINTQDNSTSNNATSNEVLLSNSHTPEPVVLSQNGNSTTKIGNQTAKVVVPSELFIIKKNLEKKIDAKTLEKGVDIADSDVQKVINLFGVERLNNLVILASLVEKETAVPEERARVAGVYTNRIIKNMLLQCDPTIIYGVGPSFQGSITKKQLNDAQNKYNTYKYSGMPPGPICSPGEASIKAALSPEAHKYLYFVATGKPDGSHTFNENLTEHNKAVQIYRQSTR